MKVIRVIISLLGVIMAVLLWAGCTEDGNPSESTGSFDGLRLLGLENGRSMIYLQTDTVTNTDFSITVTTDYETVNISGDGNDWVIKDGDESLINLKVTSVSILQNGYWRQDGDDEILSYFAVPPVMMVRSTEEVDPWQGYTPHYSDGGEDVKLIWYYAYYGFYFTREYQGRELLHLPAGSFSTYHFRTGLYRNPIDGDPDVTADEYYVPDVGLVQQNIRGGSLNRTLSLISQQ
ncbi:MAG TPA: hypothetical protein PLF13_01930 [candidate division Zixibacteria bacterium]|nr:hypothetical protein [candidate division Zixibacteria bacterium]